LTIPVSVPPVGAICFIERDLLDAKRPATPRGSAGLGAVVAGCYRQ